MVSTAFIQCTIQPEAFKGLAALHLSCLFRSFASLQELACRGQVGMCIAVQAEAEAAEAAERERLIQLAADIKEFNRLKQMELDKTERQER
jgi:hypothetical protein